MRTHRKLTSHERDKIAYWYAVGERIREIARRLGRSPSSNSDEIKRNNIDGRYHSIRAHQASEARKHNSHKKYVLKTSSTLQSYVVGKLGLGWSPEQIAGRLRKEINEGVWPPEEYINHEFIYQYIIEQYAEKCSSITHLARSLVNDCRNFLKRPDAASPRRCSD